MTSITENTQSENRLQKSIKLFFKEHKVGQILKASNAYKSKGIPIVEIMLYLIQLVFSKKSMYMNMLNRTHDAAFGKDVVYRLLNATYVNWSTFLLGIAASVIASVSGLTSDERVNAIIIDDSFYGRERSKKVELLANVFDHASKGMKFKRGFRMLTVTWSDGVTLIPLLFRHMSSENKESRYNEINPNIDKRSVGYKIRLQAIQKSTTVMLEMLSKVVKARIPAKHVLFDSWFSFPATIMEIKEIGLHVVARLKDIKTIKYLVNGEKKTLKQIYSANKKRRGRSKYLLSVDVLLYCTKAGKEVTLPARIVYVRNRNNRKDWIAIISTDLSLTEDEIIQLYGKRWDIEVFFKMCKSYLKLGSEFQGLSYDAITAHTAVVMTRYIILASEKRKNEDPRSFGELFFLCYDEIADIQLANVLAIIFDLLREVLSDCLFLEDARVMEIINQFFEKLPEHFRSCFSSFPVA